MSDPTSFTSGSATIPVKILRPSGSGTASTGAIIIAYGSDGFHDTPNGPWKTMIEGYAKDLAANGFVTLIPDYFVSTNTTSIDIESAFQTIATNRSKWEITLADAVAFAKKDLSGVDRSRIGLLGFSLGGHLCLRLRALPKVLVEYFAPHLDDLGAAGVPDLPVLIHHGEEDRIATPELIEQELKRNKASVTVKTYPDAGHGFSGKYTGDADAAAKSKSTTRAFFAAHL